MRRAQADFEKAQDKLEALREARRKSFEEAQTAGLSTRDIASETGLHFTRVAQIFRNRRLQIIGTLNRTRSKFANELEVKLRRRRDAKVIERIRLGCGKEILGAHAADYSGWCNHVGPSSDRVTLEFQQEPVVTRRCTA